MRIVDEVEGRELNKNYRGKDYATNVLTFVYDGAESTLQPLSGDVVICAPVVEREATAQHKDLPALLRAPHPARGTAFARLSARE